MKQRSGIFLQSPLSRRKPSLRAVLVVPFVVQLCAAVGLVGYLSYRTGQRAVQDLVSQLQNETTARVEQHLNEYLQKPQLINRINASDVVLGELDLSDIDSLEKHLWKQMQLFPEASYIYVGTAAGEFSGAEPVPDGLPHVAYWSSQSPRGAFETYTTNVQGDRETLHSVVENYQLTTRPWYQAAQKAGRPVWGEPYVWAAPYATVALPAVYPIYDTKNQLQAVFAVDMALVSIRDFLDSLKIGKTGEVFIMERNGLLISSSTAEVPFRSAPNGEQTRLRADRSDNGLIRETADFLDYKFKGLGAIDQPTQLSFKRDGQRLLLQVTPYRDPFGLDWLIVVTMPESDFMGQIQANTRITVWLCLGSLGLAIAAGLATARWVSHPIRQLNAAAQTLAQGELGSDLNDLSSAIALDQTRTAEVAGLTQSFRHMAAQLQESFSLLEQRVEARTIELQDRNQELAQTLAELQAVQEELIRSEKMAVLGQLVAGIAHEINTPLGAIKASVGNISLALESSLRALPALMRSLSAPEQEAFLQLLATQSKAGIELSFREERQLKRSLRQQLEAAAIDPAESVATGLARLGFQGDLTPLLPLLRSIQSRQILEVANALAAQTSNAHNIELAIDRAAKIIFALKSYSRREQTGEKVMAQITDEINVVLTIYQHQLKQGIEVIKAFEPVRAIACYPEELNQVWTNLIHNSIQAMENKGKLTLSVREVCSDSGEQILVQVIDSGPGIPPEIQDQIFEPFFTTKGPGEGTGLGLDIVRRIVAKHQGQIAVTSVPGETVFSVWLPFQAEIDPEVSTPSLLQKDPESIDNAKNVCLMTGD